MFFTFLSDIHKEGERKNILQEGKQEPKGKCKFTSNL